MSGRAVPPPAAALRTAVPQTAVSQSAVSQSAAPPAASRRDETRVLVGAGIAYVVLSVFVWWGMWSSHPTTVTTCGCGDTSLFTWFLAWPAHALAHGENPFFSTDLFHPGGVNLLANTSVTPLGLLLAPVTWIWGPVATLNISLTAAFASSALAMCWLLRRWGTWGPAAFVGGLAYGFSPFVLVALTDSHLMLGFAPLPPLIVGCLDDILFRQRWRPRTAGLALGGLVALQFLIGSEVLAIVAIAAGIGLVLVVLWALLHRHEAAPRVPHAARGLAWGAGASAVLLALPVWFALAGPAHLAGPVWGPNSQVSLGGTAARGYLWASGILPFDRALTLEFGGYQGVTPSAQYFGFGFVAVLLVGLVLWRRDRRLWLATAVGIASVLLSFGVTKHNWTAWRLFWRLPELDNLIPSRFLLVTYLCGAVALALVIDHVHRAVTATAVRRTEPADPTGRTRPSWAARLTAATTAGAVAVVALGPWVTTYAGNLPLTTVPVAVPTWYRTVAPHLRGHQVLLSFPVPFALMQSALSWQATSGFTYALAGGSGPGSLITRTAPAARQGQTVLGNASISQATAQANTVADVTAARRAIDAWGVTMVVLPDEPGLPRYERVHLIRTVVVLVTAATGTAPRYRAGAWVWSGVDRARARSTADAHLLAACGSGDPEGPLASIAASAACVLGTGGAPGT